jgi:hypothetical protein
VNVAQGRARVCWCADRASHRPPSPHPHPLQAPPATPPLPATSSTPLVLLRHALVSLMCCLPACLPA